jgi:cytochrome c oxidase cbb3-type subunit 3
MKFILIFLAVLVICLAVAGHTTRSLAAKPHPVGDQYVSYGSYGSEVDWNDPQRIIPLDYQQTQGKRIFDQQCVWCHADTTPAGPSNRSNVTPTPALMNDGTVLNKDSDDFLRKIIAQGGSGVGRSAMMPPYGNSLTDDEISTLIAYTRVIAVPLYKPPSPQEPASRGHQSR